jgi:hypothetical protein
MNRGKKKLKLLVEKKVHGHHIFARSLSSRIIASGKERLHKSAAPVNTQNFFL